MSPERRHPLSRILAAAALRAILASPASAQNQESMQKLEAELVARYGEGQRARLQRGMKQVAQFWRAEDGDNAAFEALVRTHFAGDQATLDALFERMQFVLDSINGHMTEISRDLRWHSELDVGTV